MFLCSENMRPKNKRFKRKFCTYVPGLRFLFCVTAGRVKRLRNKRTGLDQSRAPIYEALENFRRMRVVPFDVPGHKRGRGNQELTAFLGQACVGCLLYTSPSPRD